MKHLEMNMSDHGKMCSIIDGSSSVRAPYLTSVDLDLENLPDELHFLSGDLPALRHVTLSHAHLEDALPLLRPTLVTLRIHKNFLEFPSPPEDNDIASELLTAISNMPSLEVLSLYATISDSIPPEFDDWLPISLPRLTNLDVTDFASPMDLFLDCLRFPSNIIAKISVSTKIHRIPVKPQYSEMHLRNLWLGVTAPQYEQKEIVDISPTLAGKLASIAASLQSDVNATVESPLKLSLELEKYEKPSFSFITTDWRVASRRSTCEVGQDLPSGQDSGDHDLRVASGRLTVSLQSACVDQDGLDSFWFGFPLGRVRVVEINCVNPYNTYVAPSPDLTSRKRLLSYLQSMTSVRSLSLNKWDLLWLQNFLNGTPDSTSDDHAPLGWAPTLRSLKVTLEPELCSRRSNYPQLEVESLLKTLQTWMERRGPVEELELSGCGEMFTEAHAEMLISGLGATVVKINPHKVPVDDIEDSL